MAEIDTIVRVDVVADSSSITRTGFGTSMLLSYHSVFPDKWKQYSGLSEMADDGFETYHQTYRMAKAAFDQDPTCTDILVGRLPAAPSFSTQLTITSAVEGEHVKLKVLLPTTGAVASIDYTILAAATTTTVATAVEALIEALDGVASAPAAAVIDVTPVTAGNRIFIYDLTNCTITETTADAGYDTELTSLELEADLPDFYFVAIDSSSTANVSDVAAWVKSRKKMYFTASQSSGLLDGTDTVASDIQALSNDRTVMIYSKNAHEFADVAWATVIGVQDPGSITAALKELESVTTSGLNSTQKTNLETDNVNHYMSVRNKKVTRPGVTLEGEWIDIRHGIDALESRIQEDVFNLLHGRGKVPFTPAGLLLIQNAIDAACQSFVGTDQEPGLLVKGSIRVVMPAASSISSADKNTRRLAGANKPKFYASLEGAIHYVEIAGTVTT